MYASSSQNCVIRFYHVAQETPAAADDVLARLLAKIQATGQQTLIVCPSESRTTRLDDALWTSADHAFLPHMALISEADVPSAETLQRQPILLTLPNLAAAHLAGRTPILLAGTESFFETSLKSPEQRPDKWPEKILYLFHAAPAALETARAHWKTLKSAGHTLEYWQETGGKWQRKQ